MISRNLLRRDNRKPAALLLIIVAILGAYVSVTTGGRNDVFLSDLFSGSGMGVTVMRDIRLPRTVVALCLGVNLALAGVVLQAITRNPLASPAILGVNQGAAFGLALGLVVPQLAAPFGLQGLAILGAFFAGFVTFTIAGGLSGRLDGLRLVLGGVAVGAFAYAMVRFVFTLEDDLARQILRWTVGNITDVRWSDVHAIAGWSVAGLIATTVLAHRLNLMALGEAQAKGLGADPRLTLLFGAIIAAALTGSAVAVAGPIAFVGLVVPHMARLIFRTDHRVLVPMAAVLGATLLMVADGASKWVTAPIETPVGVIAAMVGAPYFLIQAIFAKGIE
jgi:iron complex transport system permease protein